MGYAYVTTLSNGDEYVPGVEALGKSLETSGNEHPRVVLATSDVPHEALMRLSRQGWEVREIAPIRNPNPSSAQLFGRFANAYNKLRAWELTDFEKVVSLDADTIVLQNVDELFERPALAAAPDFFFPDRFNSGVMVVEPSKETFARMIDRLATDSSYDGGDQGFLNTFFADWWGMPVAHRLRAGYNLHHFIYQFMCGHPSLRAQLEHEVRIVHYTVQKPWKARSTLTGGSAAWWEMYFEANPDRARRWKRRIHSLEDWSFDHLASRLLGDAPP